MTVTLSPDQSRLLATDRWGWLKEVLERWFEEPLTSVDGCTAGELAALSDRLDRKLPELLAEWFALVGHRLQPVQDAPATPQSLIGGADGFVVWAENQSVWTLLVDDNNECTVNDDDFEFPPTDLPTALHAMVLSDTLVGVWAGTRIGPLGRIAPGVRGGLVDDLEPGPAVGESYGPLPVPGNPFWGEPPRGDTDTVLRGLAPDAPAFEWMTASDDAFERLNALFPLDPPDGPYEVVLAFEGLAPTEIAGLVGPHGAPDTDLVASTVGPLGHLDMAVRSADEVRFHVSTHVPDNIVSALRSFVPDDLEGRAVIAVRPARIASFRVAFPSGRAEYVLRD